MVKIILFGSLTIALLSAQSTDVQIEQAIQLYEMRHLNTENLQKSVEILQNIVNSEPNCLRVHYELSKVYFLLGDGAKTKDEKLRLYNKGLEYGKKAIKINEDSEWSHFWYMVNLGRIGQTKGVLNSLSLVPEIKKEIAKVLEINPNHTGALDARANLYYELPGIFGGNLTKSIEDLNRAIMIDSNYTVLYVDMGKVYIKKKDYEKAHWYLNKVLEIKNPTYEADCILDDKPDVIKLLKEIGSGDGG